MTVVVVGAYTRDLFMYGPRLPHPGETVNCTLYAEAHGGKGANQAVAAARLGAETWLITGVGQDVNGQAALAMFSDEGIDMTYSLIGGTANTGVGFIIVDERGQQIIATYAGASDQVTPAEVERARPVLQRASVLLLQGEINADASLWAASLVGEQTTVILDPSPVEPFQHIERLKRVDILTPNVPEAVALTGISNPRADQVAAATGISTIVITRGADGAEVFCNEEVHWVGAPQVPVVDTTGAGDAFNGALGAALDRGLDIIAATAYACRCAAFSVSRKFCIPSYATSREVPLT